MDKLCSWSEKGVCHYMHACTRTYEVDAFLMRLLLLICVDTGHMQDVYEMPAVLPSDSRLAGILSVDIVPTWSVLPKEEKHPSCWSPSTAEVSQLWLVRLIKLINS